MSVTNITEKIASVALYILYGGGLLGDQFCLGVLAVLVPLNIARIMLMTWWVAVSIFKNPSTKALATLLFVSESLVEDKWIIKLDSIAACFVAVGFATAEVYWIGGGILLTVIMQAVFRGFVEARVAGMSLPIESP